MSQLKKYPKQIIFLLDFMIILGISTIFMNRLPGESGLFVKSVVDIIYHVVIIACCNIVCQYPLKTYEIVWRYAQYRDYIKLIIGSVFGFFLYIIINHIVLNYKTSILFIVTVWAISNLLMLILRFLYLNYINRIPTTSTKKIKLAMIGAGNAGVILLEEIRHNKDSNYVIQYFIDDDNNKVGKTIHGVKILGPIDEISDIMKKAPVDEIILAIPSLLKERKDEILSLMTNYNIRIKVLPDLLSILQDGKQNLLSTVKEININDLLGRESISFDQKEVNQFLENKVILVTGGGGSIGSELCRQIAKSNPQKLIILDYYENNAYEIQQELIYQFGDNLNLVVEIATVQDKNKMDQIFALYRPQIIFHAAAHKHVPFMEECPEEAIKNNIFGTYNTIMAADKYGAHKFVLISTDKAVNPSSMMGASKRMCEMMIQSMKHISKTEYVAVRFGNVLGSNGSVIPLFIRQIKGGGPVTITDKRAFRYFMTIPEAAQLVLRAGSMASDAEIYVLDMGHPVSILKLAENLIRLMGYVPYTEIPIKEIGIRPGEKLYEELLMQEEELTKTDNQKIFIERQKDIATDEINEKLEILKTAIKTKDKSVIKESIKEIIPTFKEL